MSASYLHGVSIPGAFNFYLSVKAALGFVRQKYVLHTFNYQAACKGKGRVTKEGPALSVLCLSLEKQRSDQPSPTQRGLLPCQVTTGLVSIWVFHESLAQGQTFCCGFFSSSLPICLLLLLCPEGGEVPSCAWHDPGQEGDEEYSERCPCLKGLGKRRKLQALDWPILLLRHLRHPKDRIIQMTGLGTVPLTPSPAFNHLPSWVVS